MRGICKTTTMVKLFIELATLGEHVLIVDADAQANALLHFGFEAPFTTSIEKDPVDKRLSDPHRYFRTEPLIEPAIRDSCRIRRSGHGVLSEDGSKRADHLLVEGKVCRYMCS